MWGRLTAIRVNPERDRSGAILWDMKCSCGGEITARRTSIISGNTKSCGCLIGEATTTHGQSGTRTYKSWSSMKQRCNNPRSKDWRYYGGRGVGYVPEWEIFENFLADMGERPPGKSLDKLNNSDNILYGGSNARWATPKEQANNRRPRTRKSEPLQISGDVRADQSA